MNKVLHVVLSLLVMGFTAGLIFKAAVATQQALNEANANMFTKTVSGRLLEPVVSGLNQKFAAYKTVAESLGDIYKEENINCANLGNSATTAAYMRAAIGLQKAWQSELVYIYVSYQIAPQVWGDCGCEIRKSDNKISCYYGDSQATQRTYNNAAMTGIPIKTLPNFNVYNQSYVAFAANMTSAMDGKGAWQAPYVYVDPVDNSVQQLVTYTYPISFDTAGKCTAAAQVDFVLSAADNLLNEYLPNSESHIVFINSQGSAPDATGTFVTSTNQSIVHPEDDLWPALSASNPYPWVYDLISLSVATLKNEYNFLNVSGHFVSGGVYYEAETIDLEWTLFLESPESYYFNTIDKWSPKIGLNDAKAKIQTIWSDTNTIGILAIGCCIGIFAFVNIIVGCCCGNKPKRSANDEYYMNG